MQVGKTQYLIRPKQKEYGALSPNSRPLSPSPESMSQFNYSDIKRPLNQNSSNLSFKGLSISKMFYNLKYQKANKAVYNKSEFYDFADKYLKSARNLFEHLEKSELSKNMMIVGKDGNVEFNKKTIPHLIWDGLIYPVKILPADILNGTVEILGKFKPLKKWADKVHEKSFFKNIRQRSKHDAEMNALRGLFEVESKFFEKGKLKSGITEEEVKSAVHQLKFKRFSPKSGNYDTKHERALNRLVTGLPPAIFLANDAYNLSRMMDDDPELAQKEKNTRFKQEASRILTSGYLTLVTLGALQKYINNSKLGIMLMTGSTVLVTEMFSRLSNGKHITRLTPEEARAENLKNNAPEKDIKPAKSFQGSEKPSMTQKGHQKPLLSLDTILKASAAIIASGFAIKGARHFVPALDKNIKRLQKPFVDFYDKISINPDYQITVDKFNKIMTKLEEAGLEDQVNDFKKLADTVKTKVKKYDPKLDKEVEVEVLKLGSKDTKGKIVADFVLAPFKFIWNTVTLPYSLANRAVKIFQGWMKTPETSKTAEQLAEAVAKRKKDDIKVLQSALDRIGNVALKGKKTPKELKDFVTDAMMKGFNVDSLSNISNSELSNLAKTAATAATMWFLMTDNYNMVMLKSNGNDVEGAQTKFKERFVQEGSRLFYQTLLIDLFNSTFKNQYNASLFGMSWISLTNTTIGEWLTRKSVGVPIGMHSRDELITLEEKQNNATGFAKDYNKFMQRLTGKRSIKSYEVDNKNSQPASAAKSADVRFGESINNSSMLGKIIRG